MMVKITELQPLEKEMITNRRYLHMHPEVGFAVNNTHDYIASKLDELGIASIKHVGKNSVIGVIDNGDSPVIALRADIDALLLQELNELDYNSQNQGKMHACGHDAHTAMLLGAAKYLKEHKDLWRGTLKLIFQEAEEGPNPGGAKGVVDSKILDDVETVYALHVSPEYPTGTFAIKEGGAFAAVCTFRITLKGKGCHAAYPHLGIDPIIMQAEVVEAIQKIVSRKLPPLEKAVISVTQVHGGTTHNIIPDSVFLEGTIRIFSQEAKALIRSEFEQILKGVSERHKGSYEFSFIEEYDVVVNTPDAFSDFQRVVSDLFGKGAFVKLEKPSMGGEDFFRYVELAKSGAIAWIGTKKDETTANSLHNPRFNIDEKALVNGAAVFVNLITNYKRSE